MGTRGLYVFRYKNKWYVFYNHFDSYPDWLGQKIVADLQTVDLEKVKEFLLRITKEDIGHEDSKYPGIMKAVENPSNYCLEAICDTRVRLGDVSWDAEYVYTIDLDTNMFVVEYYSEQEGSLGNNTQRFNLTAIPTNWTRYII